MPHHATSHVQQKALPKKAEGGLRPRRKLHRKLFDMGVSSKETEVISRPPNPRASALNLGNKLERERSTSPHSPNRGGGGPVRTLTDEQPGHGAARRRPAPLLAESIAPGRKRGPRGPRAALWARGDARGGRAGRGRAAGAEAPAAGTAGRLRRARPRRGRGGGAAVWGKEPRREGVGANWGEATRGTGRGRRAGRGRAAAGRGGPRRAARPNAGS